MGFQDFNTAAKFRDSVVVIAEGVVKRMRPETRVARVVSINQDNLTAEVSFAGDAGSLNARFGLSLIPREAGVLVRVAGKPGDYYITEILNGTGLHYDYEPILEQVNDGTIPTTPLGPGDIGEGTIGQIHLGDNVVGADQIITLEISNAILVPGSVTETIILDDSISTPKLKTNIIETHHLKSNVVTSNKLAVIMGGGNLQANSGFEAVAIPMQNALNSTSVRVTTRAHRGLASLRMTATAAGNMAVENGGYAETTKLIPVNPGEVYTISAYSQAGTTGRAVRVDYAFVTAAGANLGYVNGATSTTNNTTQWLRSVTTTAAAGATAAFLRYVVQVISPGAGEIHYVDSIQVESGDVATAWNPKTDELLPGTIKAAMLDVGAVVVGGSDGVVTFAPGYDPSTKATATDLTALASAAEIQAAATAGYAPNPFFDKWAGGAGTAPDNYILSAGTPVKETTIARTAPNALRYNVSAGVNNYVQPSTAYLGNSDFVTVTTDVYLVSGDWNGAGILARWTNTAAANFDATVDFSTVLAGKGTGAWYRVQQVLPRPSGWTGTFSSLTVWPMGGWSGIQTVTAKNIIFDQMNARSSTVEEIKAWTAGLWTYPGTTTINGGMLQTGTVIADYAVFGISISSPTITGGTFQTNDTPNSEKVVIRNDGSGGIIEFYSGFIGETPGFFNPTSTVGRPQILIKPGSTATYNKVPQLSIYSDSDNSVGIFTISDFTLQAGGAYTANFALYQNQAFLSASNTIDIYGASTISIGNDDAEQTSTLRLGRAANTKIEAYSLVKGGNQNCSVAALNTDYNQAVNFSTAFPVGVVPEVTLNPKVTNSHHVTATATGISRTGFTINYRRSAGSTGAIDIGWLALASN